MTKTETELGRLGERGGPVGPRGSPCAPHWHHNGTSQVILRLIHRIDSDTDIPYHRGTSKNLNRIRNSLVENNDGQKNNGGQIKQKKNKRQECKLWYFSKFKLGMGIQNGQSRIGGRPSASKKRISTMADDDGYTAPRVHEPVG